MRLLSTVIFSGLVIAACGGGGSNTDGSSDDPTDDSADGTSVDAPTATPDGLPAPARGFQIQSPEVTIHPGEEVTYCYYFRTPNTETMAVNHFVSSMTPGSHHMIMLTTTNDVKPPGTITTDNCSLTGGANSIPFWTYSAQTPEQDLQLPTDDGAGNPLAIEIKPNTAAYFQMHYLNSTEFDIHAHVTLNAEALAAGTPFTKTAAYVTFNPNINIPAGAVGDVETQSCSVPANAKYWMMSTHSHQHSTHTAVKNGAEVTMASDNWEHPGAQMWMTPATFYTFANKLTYECTYTNTTSVAIHTGDSALTDEMCMASGYYFLPGGAATPRICYGSALLP